MRGQLVFLAYFVLSSFCPLHTNAKKAFARRESVKDRDNLLLSLPPIIEENGVNKVYSSDGMKLVLIY